MSIQNRLLFVYTSIFMVAFVLFAAIVYLLPRNQIDQEVDADLEQLSAEFLSTNLFILRDGTFRAEFDEEIDNLETAASFFMLFDPEGNIRLRSQNLSPQLAVPLDVNGFNETDTLNYVTRGDSTMRVLTIPLFDDGELLGYLQVGRLVDSIESFNRFLVIALFVGFAGATASLFLAVLLTPSSFKPLEDMAAVTRQITNADDLSRRVPNTERTDEIGVLARSFNQLLERLERLFQTQQRLLADVSHELRTPLTAIRGNVDLMRRMGDADPESLEIIQEEIERMTRLVGDLLLLARADAGGLPLEKKKVELDNLLFEVYRQVRLLEKSVAVKVTEVDQVCIMGDVDRLKQLLLNLISNAIKYTPDGGTVDVSLSKNNGWASLSVADTGTGIPVEDLPYIFDRFYRVDKARARAQSGQGGAGLGLAIAKWIAQAHGGDIDVVSKMGEGTTFTITLPTVVEAKPLSTESAAEELSKTRPGLRALGATFRRSS
ncbi:MAG: two-component sensor histidine kinase [Ardenticatenaceae bacterium]|nr:MAG: two-component sensor histidine kinase [Ardenticatenaceae bacterium]